MKHEVTIISDDIRMEVGNKVSLAGIYDQAIVFKSLPARLLKLAFYQRWLDFSNPERVFIVVRGSALNDQELRFEVKPLSGRSAHPAPARIILAFGPFDFLREGTLEFKTFLDDHKEPIYSHQIAIRTDPHMKFE